ncbi:hypothetical protein CRYUN_Cryun28dG0044500 [Craigia yunnanensis]
MDGALLLIAANEECPQPQTIEHLVALEFMGLNDLNCNIDFVCECTVNKISIPIRDFASEPKMSIVRSFDFNKPGAGINELKGCVAGGSLLKGVLKVNQIIEIRPGILSKDYNGNLRSRPIISRVVSLFAELNKLEFAVPGGLIAVGATMDPTLARGLWAVGSNKGVQVSEGRDAKIEHWINVNLVKSRCHREQFGNIALSSLNQHRGESCTQQADQQALAAYWMGYIESGTTFDLQTED